MVNVIMEGFENAESGERMTSNEIAVLKARLVSIQDRFIAALNADARARHSNGPADGNGESTEDARTDVAEGLSWALSSESILSSLRVETMLDTEKDHANALDLVSVIRRQIAETEETLNRIEDA